MKHQINNVLSSRPPDSGETKKHYRHPVPQTGSLREISLADAIETFLEIDMGGRSSQTRDWYRKKFKFLERDIGNRLLDDLLEADLIGWYQRLIARISRDSRPGPGELSVYTVHGYVRAVRRLFRWLCERQILSVDLAKDLRLPKLPRRGRAGIADQHVVAILEAASANIRDYAILTFIESTGCRRAGVAGLRLTDLDLDAPEPLRRRARVTEKGDKQRTVRMSGEACAAMQRWLTVRQSASEFVFVDERPGRAGNGLSPGGVSQIIKRYKIKLGISGPVSPHQWRHRWCRRLLQSGMSLGLVSQGAGHESVAVTNDYYGIFATEEILAAVDQYYSPPAVKFGKKQG
jgi:site-specific recombinase XerD